MTLELIKLILWKYFTSLNLVELANKQLKTIMFLAAYYYTGSSLKLEKLVNNFISTIMFLAAFHYVHNSVMSILNVGSTPLEGSIE